MRRAVAGVSRIRLSMAWWAPWAVRASMTSESSIKNATTPAVRKSPWLMAASTASATSSSMCISPRTRSFSADQKIGAARISAPTAALTSSTSGLSA